MLARIERRNRLIWGGHPSSLEDAAHAAGGVGLGFLLYSRVRSYARPFGIALLAISFGLHAYAALVKPVGYRESVHGLFRSVHR
jgi:hypothetical protein